VIPCDSQVLWHPEGSSREASDWFDSYPYLLTRLAPGLDHITLVPDEFTEAEAVAMGRHQAMAQQLPTCLVLSRRFCYYLLCSGEVKASDQTPPCDSVAYGCLQTPNGLAKTNNHGCRVDRLDHFARSRTREFDRFGDPLKGGREASATELRTLRGRTPSGIPRGLELCTTCGDWHGECFDSNPARRGVVVPIHCWCQNHNRCARCGELLSIRRLNGNYFDERDGYVWHVPGFVALRHWCKDLGEPNGEIPTQVFRVR
jgi:hypothetical protein